MGGDRGIDDLTPVRFQRCERADLISSHQARVTRDIGREDGSKTAFDPRLGHVVRSVLETKSMRRNWNMSIEFPTSATGPIRD
jgi:hypothetical protein